MKAVRRTGTAPELIVREWLSRCKIRYTVKNKDLPGTPDLANRTRRWAIFVHGCFWHGHEECRIAHIPTRNQEFWRAKIERNRARDQTKAAELEALNYRVITLFECQLKNLRSANSISGEVMVNLLRRSPIRNHRRRH